MKQDISQLPEWEPSLCGERRESDLSRRRLLMALASLVGLSVGGCQLSGLRWRYRYRLTAEVECDGTICPGSGVIGVERNKGYREIGGKTHGEAVAVDITDRGTLFLLLRGDVGGVDWAFTMPHRAFAAQLGSFNMVDPNQIEHLSQMRKTAAVLPPNLYPQMVRFRDARDPTTLELVDPADLGTSFGRRVSLKRVWIQMTDDDITYGLQKRLPWLAQQQGALVAGSSTDANGGDAIIHQITEGDFRQGI